jgi:hypothetical protein
LGDFGQHNGDKPLSINQGWDHQPYLNKCGKPNVINSYHLRMIQKIHHRHAGNGLWFGLPH